MKKIVNIINFVRGVEPREPIDLHLPIIKQASLLRENGLKGTFLVQYDALIDPSFVEIIKGASDVSETGLWLEVVEPLVEAVGQEWKGRFSWDWHNDVGFLIGYEPEIRLKLIDKAMDKYKEVFGEYPKAVGSWHIDAFSLKYIADKYKPSACCMCRDQIGTDGYTMQGGYYNQAYYPSVNNMFCPAQTDEYKIDLPVFRMLGSDPLYAYDFQAIDYKIAECPTLEPVMLGGYPEWCDWYFRELFDGTGLSFQYTHSGQENSFGWERMGKGIEYQFSEIKKLSQEGAVEVLTLQESGEWFKNNFEHTPPCTIKALNDWKHNRYKSLWYYSRYYRAGVIWDNGVVRFRDIYLFDEKYQSHYLKTRCDKNACEFRNLPIMDSAVYSSPKNNLLAGLYLSDSEKNIVWDRFDYSEEEGIAVLTLTKGENKAVITFAEQEIKIDSNIEKLTLCAIYDENRVFGRNVDFGSHHIYDASVTFVSKAFAKDNKAQFTFNDYDYSVDVIQGMLKDNFDIVSDEGKIKISL